LYLVFTSENLTEAVDPSVGSSGWELITSALGATVAGTEMETRVYGKNHYGEASSLTLTHAESTTQAVMVAYSGAANLRGVTWLTQTGTGTSSTLANTQIEVPNGKAVSFSWDWGDGGRARIPPSGYTARFDSERLYVVDSPMRYVGQTTARALTNNSLATSPWGTWHGSLDPQLRVGGHVNTTGAIRSGSSTTGTCVVPPGGYPVGINLFALISTSHAAATTMTASDPGGNTWNMVQSTTNTVGGISLYLLWTKVTTALTEGQVITFTSGTAATKFAVNLSAFTGNLIPTTGTANNYNNTTGVGANNTLTSGMVTTTADQSLLIGGHGHVSSTLVVLPSDGGIGTFRVSTFGGSDRVAQGQYKYVGPGTTDLHADAVSNGTFVSLAQAFEVGPDTVPTTPVPPGEAIEPNPSYAYAAGRDYGFYLDKNGELKVFGALWSYNLPQSDGQPYLGNKAVIAVEEPEEGGVRPQAGGFMLGYEGHVIGIGYYDQDYWRGFPPDEQQDTPELQITEGVSGYTAIAGSSQMGTWALDSVGQPQLVYISPLATNYTAILAGVFPRPKPSGSGYVGIAVGSNNVYLLDAAGGLSAFGFGLPPAGGAGPSGGKWIKVVASATHYGVLSDQGQIYWDIEVPGDNATIAAIQAPPTEKIFADVAVGYHHTYALLNASQTAPGQVYGYGTPWNTNIGEHTVLTNPGHTGIGAGPPVGTWGFAVVSETDTRPFGLTVFGPDAPDIPPATSAPGAPNNFRVINYNGSTDTGGTHNTVTLEWERPLSGQMPAWYEITYTPMTEGAPPTSPPIGSVIATVPDNGEVRQTATIELPAGLHGPMYYMIRSIGQGGVSAGGASFWVLTTYDNTLLLGDWRKVRVTLVDYSCDQGGYVIMFEIDEIVGGTDGWTGAQIDFDMIPEGTFYFPVNSKVSVARQFGPCIAGRPTTAFHIAGLEHITVPPSPQNIVKVIIDYSICVEDGYAYWVHDDSQSIQSGNENRIDVPPLYEHCKTMMPKVQYLRDLHSPFVVSDFCLGALDSFQYDIRSGVFSVLGRPAPVVVVDSRSTASGQLIFINQGSGAEGRSALLALQDLFRSGHPMLLQVLSDYEVGHGELYFQPTSINDRWIGPDARRPEHALEVNFIEIDPPKGQVILYQIGIPLSAEPGTELVKTPEYVDWPGDTNPLFGMRFCEGGLKERYDTCDGVLYKDMTTGTKRTCNEVFHSPEMTTC
jgi:hypothetical protein